MRRRNTRATFLWALLASVVCSPSTADSESVVAMMEQARTHARQGDHIAALEILERARMVAPNSEEVLSDFAEISLAARDPVGAINALEPLMRMHPKVAKYPYLQGVAMLQVKEFEASAEALRRSLELEPKRSKALLAMAVNLLSQKRFEDAKEFATQSLEIEPEEGEALAVLAEAEEGLGELEQAELHAQRAIRLMGPHAGAYFVLGRIRMSQGQFEEARDFFLDASEVAPESSRVHYQLSLVYARLNDPENSKKHRELHQSTREKNLGQIEAMRRRAGLKESGMRQ